MPICLFECTILQVLAETCKLVLTIHFLKNTFIQVYPGYWFQCNCGLYLTCNEVFDNALGEMLILTLVSKVKVTALNKKNGFPLILV